MFYTVCIEKYNLLYTTQAEDMLQAVARAIRHIPAKKGETLKVIVNGHEYTHRVN